MEKFQVLLFYNYTNVENPEELMIRQREICQKLNLKGRIILSKEGVNGTIEGIKENTEKYIDFFLNDKRFINTQFKRSIGTGSAFPKLSIKVREEVVSGHLGEWDVNPNEITGKYISSEQLHEWIHSNKEFYIIDMRNDYEHRSGHFENSILPSLSNFRDLPQILPEIQPLRNKIIVTVCTGGIRCEKASGFLIKNGFTDVYQLQGGIVTYMEKYPNKDFLGKLYVFDGRVLMGFNTDSPEHKVMAQCEKCGDISENYVNCANNKCHDHFICCINCLNDNGKAYCCIECEIVEKHEKSEKILDNPVHK